MHFPFVYVHVCIFTDIDECRLDMHGCDVNAECLNAVGKYQCRCRPGFTGTGFSCHGKIHLFIVLTETVSSQNHVLYSCLCAYYV